MLGYKRVHVFSTLDERSLAIYESIAETDEKQVAVFCSCSNDYDELEKKIVDGDGIFSNTKLLQYMKVKDEETFKLLSSLSPNNINRTFELTCKERENEECLKCNNTKCISCYIWILFS